MVVLVINFHPGAHPESHRKQITFRSLQMFHQSELSIDIRVVTKLLHEGAFLPAT